jgi:hypothetical protein
MRWERVEMITEKKILSMLLFEKKVVGLVSQIWNFVFQFLKWPKFRHIRCMHGQWRQNIDSSDKNSKNWQNLNF